MWKNIYIRRLGYTFPVIWEILRAGLQVSLGDFNMGRHFQKRAKLKVVTRHYDPCVYGNKGHNGVQKKSTWPISLLAGRPVLRTGFKITDNYGAKPQSLTIYRNQSHPFRTYTALFRFTRSSSHLPRRGWGMGGGGGRGQRSGGLRVDVIFEQSLTRS